jgi:hypothetical protein
MEGFMPNRKVPEALQRSERFEFSITPATAELFRKHCADHKKTPSMWLRELIEDAFPVKEVCDEHVRKLISMS